METCSKDRCDNCAHFQKGYRVYGSKVPPSCNRHFHTVRGDWVACSDHQPKEGGHG